MKILHIETGKNLYGGAKQLAYLIEGLQRRGVENHLITPADSGIAEVCAGLATIHSGGDKGDLDISLLSATRRLVQAYDIDLVHVHSRRGADIWGGLGARQAKVPAVLSRRVDNPEGTLSLIFKYPLYQRVIAISDGIRGVLLNAGLSADKVVTVRSAIEASEVQSPLSNAQFRTRFVLPHNAIVLAVVAQLIPRKGHNYLLQVLPELLKDYPHIRVIFFGEGEQRKALETQIADLALQKIVSMPGFQSDMNQLFGNVDILVHPALTEGLGVSLIQAAAASVAIIASNAGGMPEIVRHGSNGLLFEPGDTNALDRCIRQLLADTELRQKMGQNGRLLATNEFSVDAMVEGNLSVYQSILSACQTR